MTQKTPFIRKIEFDISLYNHLWTYTLFSNDRNIFFFKLVSNSSCSGSLLLLIHWLGSNCYWKKRATEAVSCLLFAIRIQYNLLRKSTPLFYYITTTPQWQFVFPISLKNANYISNWINLPVFRTNHNRTSLTLHTSSVTALTPRMTH